MSQTMEDGYQRHAGHSAVTSASGYHILRTMGRAFSPKRNQLAPPLSFYSVEAKILIGEEGNPVY